MVRVIPALILPLLIEVTIEGANLPHKLEKYIYEKLSPRQVNRSIDAASLRITIGPDNSWFAFDGVFNTPQEIKRS